MLVVGSIFDIDFILKSPVEYTKKLDPSQLWFSIGNTLILIGIDMVYLTGLDRLRRNMVRYGALADWLVGKTANWRFF